jgi:hypothetical protein
MKQFGLIKKLTYKVIFAYLNQIPARQDLLARFMARFIGKLNILRVSSDIILK